MERNSRPFPTRTIEPWYVGLLLAGAIIFALLAVGRMPSRELHEAVLTSLRAIDADHAALQRDVLQARAGLLLNYDPLAGSLQRLRGSVVTLRGLFNETGLGAAAHLDEELTALSTGIDADEALVDMFKTSNALLQNSFSLSLRALDTLDEDADPPTRQALAATSDLGLLLMQFIAQPGPELDRTIRERLDKLERTIPSAAEDIASFTTHVRILLSTLPEVDRTIESIQLSHTSLAAQALQQDYLEAFGDVSAQSAWSRALLGSVSVMLWSYIAVLIFRLRTQTRRLRRQLEFENIATAVAHRFDDSCDDISVALDQSAGLFADFFDARCYAFAIVNADDFTVERSYGDAGETLVQTIAWQFGPRVAAAASDTEADEASTEYDGLKAPGGGSLSRMEISDGAVIMGRINERSIAQFLIKRRKPGARANEHESRLYAHAALVLSQNLTARLAREERKVLEERLDHAQRLEAIGTLAGGIAHEFNNALGAILGYAEMALQVKRGTVQLRHYLREIVTSAQRAKYVTDQILTFGRKRERLAKPFDLGEAVADILPLLKLSVLEQVRIDIRIQEALPAVLGNPIEIQQVVMNLCTNAAHASREGGVVQISVKAIELRNRAQLSHGELLCGSYVVLSVVDGGSGIAAGVLPHIFEPFFTTRAGGGGTGLGLAAVHGIVTGMSGRIHVESRPGQTRFDLHFPVVRQPVVPLRHFFEEGTVSLGGGQTVLIAQRDAMLRPMYEEKIAALGYEPVGFSSLASLSDWLARDPRTPELILLDLDLCEDASSLAEIVEGFGAVPALLLADATQMPPGQVTSGHLSVLRKPVSSMQLASAIAARIRPTQRTPELEPASR
ncbi:two-component system VirA-like sensor kinase [Ancylobacter oerskovii]|nr:two-component system VirA-like sensor kinase [Ancylobacter oerskovii]